MKQLILLLTILFLLSGCASPATPPTQSTESTPGFTEQETTAPPQTVPTEPQDDALVRVKDYLPDVQQELMYATQENFTGEQIYSFYDAYLRYGTVKKLQEVSRELEDMGLYLKIWDGFRPVSAQFRLWEICPDPTYVANPETGFSSHSRGNTVDLTLVDEAGQELEMPTGFDDFSALADRDYSDCTAATRENALLLQDVMERHGFTGYFGEWWHFSDTQVYPVEKTFEPPSG